MQAAKRQQGTQTDKNYGAGVKGTGIRGEWNRTELK